MPEEGIQLRPREEFMRSEEILYLAKTFVDLGVTKIRLTGGEPLIRKDAASIIRQLSQLPIELTLTTNAVLVDQFIDVFKEAGIKSINVSIDTLQRDRMKEITRRDQFDRIFRNLELLEQSGIKVKINMVVMRGVNDDEIEDFITWSIDKPYNIRFIEFMPFDGNSWDWSKGISYQEIILKAKNKFGYERVIRIDDQPNDTAKNYKVEGAKGTFAVISSVTNPFCDSCNRIRLTADGKIKNCLFSNGETDLLSALRAGEDVLPLIAESISSKKAVRAGLNSFEQFSNPESHKDNRSMTTIGG
ncbi:MAG: molybdenum cofactor biosynthesis protein A [Bacteroidia bacterium]|jgi:molybdenum cofactor biosynthesis protein A